MSKCTLPISLIMFVLLSTFAQSAEPTVKIQLEVVVFDDGKVDVKQQRRVKSKAGRTSSACGCPMKGCAECDSPRGRCSKCPLCPSEAKPMTALKPAKKKSGKKASGASVSAIRKNIMMLDANSDGRLNADEIAPRLKTPFREVDSNGDGYLDAGEITRQIKKRMRKDS